LSFPAICQRADVRDCLVAPKNATLATLRQGARVGTGSLRRQAQLRHVRPDLDVRDLRGNVDTRLRKVESGEYDAIVLAKAGLDRLGAAHRVSEILSTEVCLPAVGQGAIGVECRADDAESNEVLDKLNHAETRAAIVAERTLLAALEGGCQVPLGAWARIQREELVFEACVCSADGQQYIRQRLAGSPQDPRALGQKMAQTLLDSGAQNILQEVSRQRG
jgi:hydroxymethylbilane synthase